MNAWILPTLPLLIAVAIAPAAAATRNQCYDRYQACSAICTKSPAPSYCLRTRCISDVVACMKTATALGDRTKIARNQFLPHPLKRPNSPAYKQALRGSFLGRVYLLH